MQRKEYLEFLSFNMQRISSIVHQIALMMSTMVRLCWHSQETHNIATDEQLTILFELNKLYIEV